MVFYRQFFQLGICAFRSFSSTSATSSNTPLLLNAFSQRTHTCGELRLADVGKRVKIYGWLAHKRVQRKNAFLVLRDAYGKVQAFATKELAAGTTELHMESSICVEGIVVDRGANRNKEMATGDIEVHAERLEIINPVIEENLPVFSCSVNETIRQKHRYLDLRWEQMQTALRLRAKIISQMRRYLEDQCGFIDIQTPTLAHFTPGGAAEFMVPANKNGECFSLPQSPQIYKQLLMCGSMDRYYQIAICYRDEKISPFRQPEFAQLDLELSFTSQEMVMGLVEQIILHSWPEELGTKPTAPFPRISYSEALTKYGSDKPDLRIPWEIFDSPMNLKGGRNAKMFIAKRATPHLTEENLTKLRHLIGMLPQKEDFQVVGGPNSAHPLLENESFLQKHNFAREEDALVICRARNQKNVLEVLGRLRNFLAEATGLRRSVKQFRFLWVHKFPLFTRNNETGMLESSHHPFTAPIPEHVDAVLEGKDLERIEAQHYDLVLNGVEVGGGSIRIHNAALQRHVLEDVLKLDTSHLQHLLDALSYGAPPHGGFALGLDRYSAILNAKGDPNASIRSVIAFPKSKLGQCFMSGSPAVPPREVLDRYGLVRKEDCANNSFVVPPIPTQF